MSTSSSPSLCRVTLRDPVVPAMRLLFVGVNPGLRTVALQAHFVFHGNQFYPALQRPVSSLDRRLGRTRGG
jgi:double-stranded uracil-DNA glycosylase